MLANRLTQDGKFRVLLVEAGPKNGALSLRIPAAVLQNLQSSQHNWAFKGEPEPELAHRVITHDRGKTLGGSSSINGMVFIRGHALDFEGWRQSGCEGWGYADVLPYFKRMENYSGGETEYRGEGGPLNIYRPSPQNPIYRAFLDAGEEAGYPRTEDICGFCQEGFGVLDMSVHKGQRSSTATDYLDPAKTRKNLEIITGAQVQKILLDGISATGVRYKKDDGQIVETHARREVLLSAGAVGSPQLLMLSGIGPASHLQSVNVPVIVDLPGVGQNLMDHPDFVMKYRCLQPVSIWPKTRLAGRFLAGLRWLLRNDGICASNQFEAVACLRSSAGVEYPDIQLTISPVAVNDETWEPLSEHAFQIHIGLMRTYSRGHVYLRDSNASTAPRILVNYMKDPRDREVLRKGIRLVRELTDQPAFDNLCGEEIYPGISAQSDQEFDTCLEKKLTTQWHLSGTAKMGNRDDRSAVVDAQGKVFGVNKLRVVDASIMPAATNGNTNSPTIMIAEKLSDSILGKAPLPRIDAPFWQSCDYDKRQR